MFWLRTCLPYMAAAVTDSNLRRRCRCRCCSLPRRSALSGAIKPCWRKKKLFCQTDSEDTNAVTAEQFIYPSRFGFWSVTSPYEKRKRGHSLRLGSRSVSLEFFSSSSHGLCGLIANSFVEITKRCGPPCQQLKRCNFLHRFFCQFVL